MTPIEQATESSSIPELEAMHRERTAAIKAMHNERQTIHDLWERKQLAKQAEDAKKAPAHLNRTFGVGGKLG